MSATDLSNSVPPQSTDSVSNRNRQIENTIDIPVERINIHVIPRRWWYIPIKAIIEYLFAIVFFVMAVPFVVVAAVFIKLTSPGPVFYLQTRLGKNGRLFRLIKLRTMVHNAEAETGPVWSKENDPRITRAGNFLRETHIDEFPQLINVLLGHMVLIGPRPERPEIAEHLAWQISNYEQRLNVRPGITGIAQLNLPPDSDLDSVRRKLLHDLYYIRYMNPWLDLKIFFVTGWVLVRAIIRNGQKLVALPSVENVNDRLEHLVGPESDLVLTTNRSQTE